MQVPRFLVACMIFYKFSWCRGWCILPLWVSNFLCWCYGGKRVTKLTRILTLFGLNPTENKIECISTILKFLIEQLNYVTEGYSYQMMTQSDPFSLAKFHILQENYSESSSSNIIDSELLETSGFGWQLVCDDLFQRFYLFPVSTRWFNWAQ